MRFLLAVALLLAVPATAADTWQKVATDDRADYYVDRGGISRHPGYVGVVYKIVFKESNPRGKGMDGIYRFSCKGDYQLISGEYFDEREWSHGDQERPDSSMKKITDPPFLEMEKYVCK